MRLDSCTSSRAVAPPGPAPGLRLYSCKLLRVSVSGHPVTSGLLGPALRQTTAPCAASNFTREIGVVSFLPRAIEVSLFMGSRYFSELKQSLLRSCCRWQTRLEGDPATFKGVHHSQGSHFTTPRTYVLPIAPSKTSEVGGGGLGAGKGSGPGVAFFFSMRSKGPKPGLQMKAEPKAPSWIRSRKQLLMEERNRIV